MVSLEELSRFGVFFQKFGTGHTYFMDYDIRPSGMFNKVLVGGHVTGNNHRPSFVVHSKSERFLDAGMLDFERGDSDSVLVVYDSFRKILGNDGRLLW